MRRGGPRVVAVLVDPVRMLAERQLSITGDQLRIEGYPVCPRPLLEQGD